MPPVRVKLSRKMAVEGRAVGEGAGDVDDVVFEGFEEVGGGDLSGAKARIGRAGGRRAGNGVGREHEQGDDDETPFHGYRRDEAGTGICHKVVILPTPQSNVTVSVAQPRTLKLETRSGRTAARKCTRKGNSRLRVHRLSIAAETQLAAETGGRVESGIWWGIAGVGTGESKSGVAGPANGSGSAKDSSRVYR